MMCPKIQSMIKRMHIAVLILILNVVTFSVVIIGSHLIQFVCSESTIIEKICALSIVLFILCKYPILISDIITERLNK